MVATLKGSEMQASSGFYNADLYRKKLPLNDVQANVINFIKH
jgi:hypothetical protein